MVVLFEPYAWLSTYPYSIKWGWWCPLCEYRVFGGVATGDTEEEVCRKIWEVNNKVTHPPFPLSLMKKEEKRGF